MNRCQKWSPSWKASVSTQENIESFHNAILEAYRIGSKRATDTLIISYERVFHIVYHN